MDEIDAQQVFGYALYKDGKNTKLSYPLEKFASDVSGRSFHNGRFIMSPPRHYRLGFSFPLLNVTHGPSLSLEFVFFFLIVDFFN